MRDTRQGALKDSAGAQPAIRPDRAHPAEIATGRACGSGDLAPPTLVG
jgi:hypothetical protein